MRVQQTIRAFIAVGLPADVKEALSQINDELDAQLPSGRVRWVKPAQMHLTLNFLGDTPVAELPVIQQLLDEVASHYRPFALQLGRLGCFPHCRQPRVIWVGLEEERLESGDLVLGRIKRELEEGLRPLGWEPEQRPFRAHLTLGRIKDRRGLEQEVWTAGVPRLSFPVSALHLIQSDLRPTGPVYTTHHIAVLQEL